MKKASYFIGWNFDTTWAIRSDSTYPGLRKLDNAPFAFVDTFSTNRTFILSKLLLNDCDIETARSNLTLKVISASAGTTDGISTLVFPYSVPNGTVATIKYRIGEIRAVDTFWGMIATAIVTLDTTVTAAELNPESSVPKIFSLSQNYPNPFNPSTNISFNLPTKSFVSLKVFDLIGREVATIISEEMSAGNHTKQWNAADMPSGVYFYRLQTRTCTETKKLVLLR
jgi:hypothetical protein